MTANKHKVIRTPIDVVNVIGAGGIVEGTITELWGPPGAGKSAYAYDSASMFLEDCPDGVVVVIDPENSTDRIRLEHVFKIDMDRLLIRNARSLEEGYGEIYKIFTQLDEQMGVKTFSAKELKELKKGDKDEGEKKGDKKAKAPPPPKLIKVEEFIKTFNLDDAKKLIEHAKITFDLERIQKAKSEQRTHLIQTLAALLAFHGVLRPERPTPVLIIWDTLVASKPRAEVMAALAGQDPVNAGGIGLRARINEENLAIIMSNMEGRSVTLYILNQIRLTGFGTYSGPYETSSGGNALKHNCHYRLAFGISSKATKAYDDRLMMNIGTTSTVDIEKSKFGPTLKGIKIFIDDRLGGRIVQRDEAAIMCHSLKLLNATGGPWYQFIGETESWTWARSELSEKSGRWIENNPAARMKCIDVLARHYRMNYVTLDTIYQMTDLKIGELNEAQRKFRKESIENFSFQNVLKQMAEKGKTNERTS